MNLRCGVRVSSAFMGNTLNLNCWCSLLYESNYVGEVDRSLQESIDCCRNNAVCVQGVCVQLVLCLSWSL